MVVVTTSTLVTPPLCPAGHHPARRSVSLLPAALVACVVPAQSRQTRSKQQQKQQLGSNSGSGWSQCGQAALSAVLQLSVAAAAAALVAAVCSAALLFGGSGTGGEAPVFGGARCAVCG
jgi:hypothetical protein